MNNQRLAKILKCMQKMSGKSIGELSDETELTVDTINNLLYARVQKPGFFGICSLTEAMGFKVEELLVLAKDDETDEADAKELCEKLTGFLQARENGENPASAGKTVEETKTRPSKGVSPATQEALDRQKADLDQEHERQLDRFRSVHQGYAEKMKQQYDENLREVKMSCEKALANERAGSERLRQELTEENRRLQKKNSRLTILLIVETALIAALTVADLLLGYIGWFRR